MQAKERKSVNMNDGDVISTMPEDTLESIFTFLSNQEKHKFALTCKWIRKVILRLGKMKFILTENASKSYYDNQRDIGLIMEGRYICVKYIKRNDIVDLICLENRVQEIILDECNSFSNVSPLRYCKSVTLKECSGVRDISSLGNVDKLIIWQKDASSSTTLGEDSLIGFPLLSNVKELELRFCKQLCDADLKFFKNIKKVTLRECASLTSVSCLANNHSLELFGCDKVTDAALLVSVRHLGIKLSGISAFDFYLNKNNFRTLMKDKVKAIRLGVLFHHDPLHDQFMNKVSDLECVRGIDAVLIANCPRVSDLSPLSSTKEIFIGLCNGISDVSPLANAREITLLFCLGITDVSSLANIPLLRIERCLAISNWGCLTPPADLRGAFSYKFGVLQDDGTI